MNAKEYIDSLLKENDKEEFKFDDILINDVIEEYDDLLEKLKDV